MATLLLLVACFYLKPTLGYHTYYVEQDCSSGNLTVQLDATGDSSAALLRVSPIRDTYTLALDCRILISVPPGYKVVVAVRQLGFRSNLVGTCIDYLKIQGVPKCESLFRVDEERHFFSSRDGRTLEMLYHVSNEDLDNITPTEYPGMGLTATAAASEGGECPEDVRFRCANGLCVWSGLRCDTHNNCGDVSDEDNCGGGTGGGSTVLIILGSLILLLLLIMCSATLLCSRNEAVRRFSGRLRSRTLSYLPRRSK